MIIYIIVVLSFCAFVYKEKLLQLLENCFYYVVDFYIRQMNNKWKTD